MTRWVLHEIRDATGRNVLGFEWRSELGVIRPTSNGAGRQRWIWTDVDGRESAPLETFYGARLFAERHRVVKYGG